MPAVVLVGHDHDCPLCGPTTVKSGTRNVTVNAVAPGVIETEMSAEVMRRAKDLVMEHIPLKRLGTAEEIAATVAFLASAQASFTTGQVLEKAVGIRKTLQAIKPHWDAAVASGRSNCEI